MENNYQEYLNSFAWSALKKVKLEQNPDCECCGDKATTVHHLSYERRGSETEEDIVSICERCHYECHHVNGYQIKNDEEILKRRFVEVRDELGNTFSYENDTNITYNEVEKVFYNHGIKLKSFFYDSIYTDGERLFLLVNKTYSTDDNYDFDQEYYFQLKREEEWGDGPENDGNRHPAYDGYDYDSYVYGDEYKEYEEEKSLSEQINQLLIDKFNVNNNSIIFETESFFLCRINNSLLKYLEDLGDYYFKLYNYIYFGGEKLSLINLETFQVLKYGYAKDVNFVYLGGKKIQILHGASFQVLNTDYTKDRNGVYYNNKKLEGLDAKTFEIISLDYTKDKNGVYYNNKKLEGLDIKTFEYLDYGYAKDKNFVYRKGDKIKGLHSTSFQVLNEKYARDKNYVYRYTKKVEGVDSKTFELINNNDFKDKNYIYKDGEDIYSQTLYFFQEGKNIQEIANIRNITVDETQEHIVQLYASGKLYLTNILKLSRLDILKTIKKYLEGKDIKKIKMEKMQRDLGENITYFDIKIGLKMIEKGDL